MEESLNERILQGVLDDLKGLSSEPLSIAQLRYELAAALDKIKMLVENNLHLRQQLVQSNRYAAESLAHAYNDELTGLPNRRLLKDRLAQALAHAERHKNQAAVLVIDLDGFKAVNDTYGHSVGDHLLREVAMRLAANIRVTDTVCRYGGDEFVVLLPEVEGASAVHLVMEKIRASLREPCVIHGRVLKIGASIGHAIYPQHGASYHDLIDHADAGMYREKALRG